jgi:RNA recognition motif-containing protein
MVYIEGLHVSITVADLKALFAPFGTVLWSRLVIDTNSYSSVSGYVEMSTPAESVAAITGLNGTTLLSSVLRVVRFPTAQFDKSSTPHKIREDT